MAGLSMATATRIAVRELKSSRAKFAFVVLSVAVGVAALVGVRGFSASFRAELLLRARSIMAGDLAARMNVAATDEQADELENLNIDGVQGTPVTEMLSMASAANSYDPLLVSIKAVDPGKFPFYGSVQLQPAMPVSAALTDSTCAVGDDLLLRLKLHVGDSIRLGATRLRIAAVVVDEPDRLTSSFAAGPRVLLSQAALEHAQILAPGSRANRRFLFKLRPPLPGRAASDADVNRVHQKLESILPAATVTDYRDANPGLTKALDGATGMLSLMSLVAMVLGAVGVAMAMRSHLQARMDSIAIMKSLGAGSAQIMRIYVLQTVILGLVGGLCGVALGLCVQMAFPLLLERLLHLTPAFRIDWRASGLGLLAGMLTTLLFTLPPLLDIRSVRPILILRRAVESMDDPFSERMLLKIKQSALQLAASVVIVAGLIWLAARVSDSSRIGLYFGAGLVVALLVLLGVSALLLFVLRQLLERTRLRLPSVLRHGLANLYRPGNPSAALLAALGLGVMQIALVYITQESIVREMQSTTTQYLPNMFLVDMTSAEVPGIRTLLQQQPEVKGSVEMVPVVTAKLAAVDGTPIDKMKIEGRTPRFLQTLSLSWEETPATPPAGDRIIAGSWWSTEQAATGFDHPVVAVQRGLAGRLHLKPGQQLTFSAQGDEFTAVVAAVFEADVRHTVSRAEFLFPQATLNGLPVVWYGGVHSDPTKTAELRRVLYEHFPTVTVIDVAATLETVRQVLLQITWVIQFLAAFSIVAGLIILSSSIAGTKYRRIREVVVLKTLGGTRARIAAVFSIEFAVLGLIAGAVGLGFANVLARVVLHRALHFDYGFEPGVTLTAWLALGALTVIAGWAASHRVLGQKPLEVLREE